MLVFVFSCLEYSVMVMPESQAWVSSSGTATSLKAKAQVLGRLSCYWQQGHVDSTQQQFSEMVDCFNKQETLRSQAMLTRSPGFFLPPSSQPELYISQRKSSLWKKQDPICRVMVTTGWSKHWLTEPAGSLSFVIETLLLYEESFSWGLNCQVTARSITALSNAHTAVSSKDILFLWPQNHYRRLLQLQTSLSSLAWLLWTLAALLEVRGLAPTPTTGSL